LPEGYREQLASVVGKDETVSIIELWAQGPFVFGNNWGRGGYSLYNSLQLSAPEIVEQEILNKEQYRMISMEVLPEYAGDYIFLTVYAEDGGDKMAEEIKASAVWQSLPAYKNNRIIELNIDDMAAGDPISMEKQLDIQVEKLLAIK
jgi:ABC-type Fe3+-hydroxamate transport system substrate-binding protein